MRAAVVIPTYDRAHMLPDALASLSFQPCDVFVYDDGSTDGTAEAATGYRYRKEAHRGLTPAFNHAVAWALSESDAPYIAWLGSDDDYTPDSVKLRADYLDAHPETGVVFTDLTFGAGARWREGRPHRIDPSRYDISDFSTFQGNVHTGTAMFRREVWREWNESIVTGGADLAWVYALACDGVGFGYIPRVTYHVRRHPGRSIEVRRRMDPEDVKRELNEVYYPHIASLKEGAR